jgi:hypothetical protein
MEEQNVFPLLTVCENPAEYLEWVSFYSFIISVMWLLQSVLKAVSQNFMAHTLAHSDLPCQCVTVVLHVSWRICQTCQYIQQSMRQKCGLTYHHHSCILHDETYCMCVGQLLVIYFRRWMVWIFSRTLITLTEVFFFLGFPSNCQCSFIN